MKNVMNRFKMRSTIVVMVAVFGLFGAILLAPNAADAASTGWKIPSANMQNGSGDKWTDPWKAYTNNNQYTKDDDGEKHRYYNFGFGIPGGQKINGIHVQTGAKSDDSSGCKLGVSLSWNGGSNWTAEKTAPLSGSKTTKNFGSASNTWGRTWTVNQTKNGNFRLRVHDIDPGSRCNNGADTKIDWIKVKITYAPANICGDGYVTGNEQCDGGNACTNKCTWKPATVHTSKVVCDEESKLPNWGAGGPAITSSTASDYAAAHDGCELVDWSFEWAPNHTNNPGDNTIGPAGGKWATFSNSVEFPANTNKVWFREVWDDAYYPFSSDHTIPVDQDVSAEFYCGNDVLNYDNYDWLVDLQPNMNYYCVGFNAEYNGSITGRKYYDVNKNGTFDQVEKDEAGDPNRLDGWNIYLKDTNLNLVQSMKTGDDSTPAGNVGKGQYRFTDVAPGDYFVCEENRSSNGWFQSNPTSGQMWNGTYCFPVTVTPNEDVTGVQFGNYQSFDLHGYKWYDLDGNGIRNCDLYSAPVNGLVPRGYVQIPNKCKEYSEDLLSDWVINLYKDGSLTPYMTTSTMNTEQHFGWYWFEGLPAGDYRVCEELQTGWEQTSPMFNSCHMITLPNNNLQTLNAVLAPEYNFGNRLATDLTITKEVDLEIAEMGEILTYTITVDNNGDAPAYSLEVVDTLPVEVTLIEATVVDGGVFDTIDTITWMPIDVAGMSSWSTSFEVTVNELPDGDSKIENLAELYQGVFEEQTEAGSPEGPLGFINNLFGISTANAGVILAPTERVKLGSDTAITLVTVFGGPFLTIEKDVDATEAGPGETLNYTIIVTNIGDQPATDVVIDDLLPEGLIYQDGTTTKQWLYDVIASGASETINYVAIIEDDAVTNDYTNIAKVGAAGLEVVEDDATTVVTEEVLIPIVLGDEALPSLTVEKTVNVEFANPGDTITYTIVVENIGDAMAEDTVLIDHIAAGMQFTDTVAPTHTWMLGIIAPGNSVTTTYDVIILRDNEPGIYRNTAEVWAQGVDNVFDTADVELRSVTVLGADTLPTTGGSVMTFIYLIGAGLVVAFSGLLLKLTAAKK